MKPTDDQLLEAAEWLDCYEGSDLSAVSQYLRDIVRRREINALAKKHDVPPALVRKALRKLAA